MNIMIIGSGAREHAIARAVRRSPQPVKLHCYGNSKNPGIYHLTDKYAQGNLDDNDAILEYALQWKIKLAIIGPEAPLANGLADILWQHKIPTIGPTKNLAQLETSKSFTRQLIKKYQIPGSPQFQTFDSLDGVESFLKSLGEGNYVVKADGLMSGKGVKVAGDHLSSFADALSFCQEILDAGQSFLIEEKLIGEEFSLLCFCDGETLYPMPLVQDHKRAFINDTGPNTGGMGSYSDTNHRLPFLTLDDIAAAQAINVATLNALKKEYREKYRGILYGSFIATSNGVRLIEYNVRFGDPEAINLLALLKTDFVAICQALVSEQLQQQVITFANLATVCKYAVPNGYPDRSEKNVILDITQVDQDHLYFAGVEARDHHYITTGSRAVAILGIGNTVTEAEQQAEREIQKIAGAVFYRKDIGTESLIHKRVQHMRELRQCVI